MAKSLLNVSNLALTCFYRSYAVKSTASTALMGLGKGKKVGPKGATVEKIKLPVETDTYKLVNYLCGSNLKSEGGEDLQIKPDSEYPDWLWELNMGKSPPLEEMDPESREYWIRVRKMGKHRQDKLKKMKKQRLI